MCLFACSDDSSSGSNTDVFSTKDDLPECTEKITGDTLYVESDSAEYVYEDDKWTIIGDSIDMDTTEIDTSKSSSSKGDVSSSSNVFSSSASSSSQEKSSGSGEKSSSSMALSSSSEKSSSSVAASSSSSLPAYMDISRDENLSFLTDFATFKADSSSTLQNTTWKGSKSFTKTSALTSYLTELTTHLENAGWTISKETPVTATLEVSDRLSQIAYQIQIESPKVGTTAIVAYTVTRVASGGRL